MSDQRHDAVSRRAYELWEKDGGDHGRHEDHWHQASREIDDVEVTAPDGTTLPVDAAVEVAADAAATDAGQPTKPARRKAAAKVETVSESGADAAPAPVTPAAKAAPKSRKPRAK